MDEKILEIICENCPATYMIADQEQMDAICDCCQIEKELKKYANELKTEQ